MKPMKKLAAAVNTTELRPHQMGLMYKSIADTYPTLSQTIQELIQNSIDVNAKHVEVFINARIKIVYVCDNGDGATRMEFNDALCSILKSSKSKDKFGRFGRGTISPLTKCHEFSFQSRGKRGPAHRWTFHCNDIIASPGFPEIPWEVVSFSGEKPWWRTQVLMKGVFFNDTVKYRVNLPELKAAILSGFATKMRQLETTVKITFLDGDGRKTEECFTAQSYSGKPLPIWESNEDTPAGKVIVRLYKADNSSPIPITIGQIGDPFRLEWKTFFNSVTAFSQKNNRVTFDGKDIHALFRSGLLTGEIECENITIHPERQKFERDDALDWFVIILEKWFTEIGKQIHADAQIHAKSSLYQQIAIDAVQRIEKHPLVDLFLHSVKFGTVGRGHADTGVKALGMVVATDVVKGHNKGKGTHAPEEGMTVNEPTEKVTRPGHVPLLVVGDDGNERKIVRKDSRGLMVDIVPFPGLVGSDAPLFQVETDMGRVLINQLAPNFNVCADRGEKVLRRFIDMVVMAALQSAVSSDQEKSKSELEQYVKYTTQFFLAGDQRTV